MPTWGPLMTCAGIWISSHEAFGLGKQFPKSLQTGDTACAGSVGQGIPDFAAVVENPSDPALKTHKLSGRLSGLWACWVEYDCRIIFASKQDPVKQEQLILLVDIGTHDEVY